MKNPIIRIANIDGNVVDREMTAQELAQWEADIVAIEAQAQAKAEAAANKAAAEAKLAALGLTSDDLKALGLGGN